MHLVDLCIKWCFIIEVCFYLMLIISFISRKIFKAYYGFRVLYVFPVPSAGHGPIGSGRDKVGIRAMVLSLILNWRFVFSHTTAVLGCQTSILSFLLPVFCVVSVLWCLICLVVFLE